MHCRRRASRLRDGEVFEEHVALDGEGRFVRTDRPADALLAAAVRHVERQRDAPFPDGYRSELLPQLPYWVQAVIGGLRTRRDAVRRLRLSAPRVLLARSAATARCVRSAAIAWSRRVRAARACRTSPRRWISPRSPKRAPAPASISPATAAQASFLIGNGLEQNLAAAEARAHDEARRYELRQEAKHLTLPGEMGERFQAMGFQRDVEFGTAFLAGDLSWRL